MAVTRQRARSAASCFVAFAVVAFGWTLQCLLLTTPASGFAATPTTPTSPPLKKEQRGGRGATRFLFAPRVAALPSAAATAASGDGERSERGHLFGEGDPTHEPTILQRIAAKRLDDVAEAKASTSEGALRAMVAAFDADYGPPLDLYDRVAAAVEGDDGAGGGQWGMALAAEFKRASPSKGDIAVGLDAADQAAKYAAVGAAVISVLTEGHWFKGSLRDMRDARVATQMLAAGAEGGSGGSSSSRSSSESSSRSSSDRETRETYERGQSRAGGRLSGGLRPAILRKDFLVDPYQVLEARAHGADTVLLIVAILEVRQLRALVAACRAEGMEPLVEVHTEEELDVALACGARVIGVNNRNLHTFRLDLGTTERIAQRAFERCATLNSEIYGDEGQKP